METNMPYLIPANAKRGQLILNIFTLFDLVLFGAGVFITVMLVIIKPPTGLVMTSIVLAPALLTGLLVTPVPNYHNVLTVLFGLMKFYVERRIFLWKGWCLSEYYGDTKK